MDSGESGHDEVSKGLRAPSACSEHIFQPGELQELLRCTGSNDSSSSRSRDKSDDNRATLSSDFTRNSVRLSKRSSPVSFSDRND